MADDLDITVRDHATDRWLSSRFVADAAERADLIALYALDHELTRIPHLVSDPLMGEIRMTWWREGLEEIAEGRPVRPHPVLKAIAAGALPAVALAALAEARLGDLDEPKTGAALIAHIDATEGLVMALAARRLSTEATADHVAEAARAVGLARVDAPAALKALAAARSTLRALPVAAFPAVAHAVFVPDYARSWNPSSLRKRVQILLSVLRGQV